MVMNSVHVHAGHDMLLGSRQERIYISRLRGVLREARSTYALLEVDHDKDSTSHITLQVMLLVSKWHIVPLDDGERIIHLKIANFSSRSSSKLRQWYHLRQSEY